MEHLTTLLSLERMVPARSNLEPIEMHCIFLANQPVASTGLILFAIFKPAALQRDHKVELFPPISGPFNSIVNSGYWHAIYEETCFMDMRRSLSKDQEGSFHPKSLFPGGRSSCRIVTLSGTLSPFTPRVGSVKCYVHAFKTLIRERFQWVPRSFYHHDNDL
ncbi:unnamed protein product [Nezara viridula]|uniref:Uncharacterized protein n=1 Tax=Nezara viridula TaxID=85310 RepID=A0A9P0MPF9_NEZVI|nr:unnamed protein product [Nezara viridula]